MRKFFATLAVIGALLCVATYAMLSFVWRNRGAESEWLPAWSSAQQHIAFECMFFQSSDWLDDEYSFFSKGDICIFNRGNNELTRLTTERSMSAPAWSPNGNQLAWLQGNDTIMIWDSSTNRFETVQYSRQFHGSEAEDGGPEWSLDGRRIFVQGDGAILDVQQMTFTDPLEEQRNLDNCCFNWSPDGRYLAYKRVIGNDSSGYHWKVVIIENDQPIYINEPETYLFGPMQWSPDGSILAWVGLIPSTTHASHYQLALTNVATGRTEVLTFGNGFVGISGIAWSPNGEQIAVRQGDQLQIVDLRRSLVPTGLDITIQKENIALRGSSFAGLSWSPDGKFIAYETDWQESSRIWILEPSSNTQIPLVSRFGD